MKKSLLLSAAILTAGAAFAFQGGKGLPTGNDMVSVGPKAPERAMVATPLTRGAGAMEFSYATELYGSLRLNGVTGGTTRVYMGFEMKPEDIKAYAGNTVTGFTAISPAGSGSAANTIRKGRFFYSTTLEGEDYTQDFAFSSKAYSSNVVSLDTPYTITGEEETLVFGYSLVVPKSDNMYYFPIDYVPNDYPGSCIFNVSDDDSFPTGDWGSFYNSYGALAMWIKIEGEDLPENIAEIGDVDTPMYLPMSGAGVDMPFIVRNGGSNPLSSIEVKVSVTDTPDLVQTIEFSPIAYNETAIVSVNGVKGTKSGFGKLSMQITKVNGEAKEGKLFEANVPVYDNGYPSKVVVEDATGTWCGWCPGGIEALEYLKATYPDRAVAIGVHNGDDMAIDSYQAYIENYVSGFPNLMYNRSISQTPTDDYENVCAYIDMVMDFFDFPTYADVELTGVTASDNSVAEVSAKTTFALNTEIPHYLSFVVVEDGVGPYIQQNYFYRNQYGLTMNGWESSSSRVATVFNDVARYYKEFPGIKGSLPSKIEEGVTTDYSISLPLSNVKKENFRVIALITNGENGRIVNACQIDMEKDKTPSAVEGIESADAHAEFYNLNGMKVAEPTEGIYIRRQGGKAEKVIIR